MDPALAATLAKLLLPIGASAFLLAMTRRRGIPWGSQSGLGLRAPRALVAVRWLASWIAWMALSEVLIAKLGMQPPDRWREYPALVFLLGVAAIGLAGPVLEELLVRGLVLTLLRRTRLVASGAVLVTAGAWALMHVQYEPALVALIFLDGVLLGTCRVRTGTLLLPMAMHALGNLYSIWQSTHG